MRGTYVVGWLDVSEWGDGLRATDYGLRATDYRLEANWPSPVGRRPSPPFRATLFPVTASQ